MKKITLLLVLVFLSNCATKKNIAVTNADGDLVGVVAKESFKQEPYATDWFNDFYGYYKTDKEVVKAMKPLLKDIKIKGFMGTWCGDSQREIPNFYKLLDETAFDYKNLTLVAVNQSKTANGLEEGFNVLRVPTFIFYKNGKEIGRFVEHAVDDSTIEADILKIISGEPYKHPYQN